MASMFCPHQVNVHERRISAQRASKSMQRASSSWLQIQAPFRAPRPPQWKQ